MTLSPRTPTSNQPMINVPMVVLATIAVLVAIHVALWILGEDWQTWSLYAFSFIPSRLGGPQQPSFPQGAQYWSFLTYGLLHADAFHLGSNCLWLLIFSTPLARRWKTWQYIVFCSVTAICGAAAVVLSRWGEFIIVIGASATVSASLAAAMPIMFAPRFNWRSTSRRDYQSLRVQPFTALLGNGSALAFAALFLVVTLFSGASQMMTGTAFLEERNIAWEAHLGGFIAGLVAFYILDRWTVSSPREV